MTVTIPAKAISVCWEYDVVVVGGGPAGIGAAVGAARGGARVLLLEKRAFLGGNITASYVETCNYFLRGTPFKAYGLYAELEREYRSRFGSSHDIRPDSPHRFSSEYLKIFLDSFVGNTGVEILFHSFVNDLVMENGRVAAVIIQSKQGPLAVRADVVIDCTGDGDVAFAAGVPFDQGRDLDHLCQPGTVSFRLAGADTETLTQDGIDQLKVIGRQFREDYRSGRTGLSCKRQDLPFGRLTKAGQVTYVNYPCAYGIDPTDVADLSRGEMECRRYIEEMLGYMNANFKGFEGAELSSIAHEICFRDSRRIHGEYTLTIDDMESNRHFDDCIAVFPRFYDMLAPNADMDGDGSVEGGGYKGHIYVPVEGNRSFEIPYRSLLAVGVENLLVAGRCISADHVAQSGIRAISACMYTGQAAGTAAAMAGKLGQSPKNININELRENLKKQNVML